MATAAAERKKVSGSNVRIDPATTRSLEELVRATGQKKSAILREAIHEYRKTVFFNGLRSDFEALKKDPAAWQEELRERALWDTTLSDGLSGE